MQISTTRLGAVSLGLVLCVSLAGASLAATTEIEDDFESGVANWDEHLVQTNTTRLPPSSTDTMLPAVPSMFIGIDFPSLNLTNFLKANTWAAPDGTCMEGNLCTHSCPGADAGTTRYVLINKTTYDPVVSGTPESIEVRADIKNWPQSGAVLHNISHRIEVVIRQDDGSGSGYRFFNSVPAWTFVQWQVGDAALGSWDQVVVSVPDLTQFREYDPPDLDPANPIIGAFDLDSPFEIGLGFAQTATHAKHNCGGTGDVHDWVIAPNIGVDEFLATVTAGNPSAVPALGPAARIAIGLILLAAGVGAQRARR